MRMLNKSVAFDTISPVGGAKRLEKLQLAVATAGSNS